MHKKSIEMTRKIPKQSRSIETSNIVLQATAQFLMRYDYAILSTNKIAKMAGVSIGTLYQYYSSKEEVMLALINKQLDEDFDEIRNILEGDTARNFDEAIRKLTCVLIQMFSVQTQLRLVIYGQFKEYSMLEVRKAYQQRVRELILDNFEKHSRGEFIQPTELSLYILTNAVVGTILTAARERMECLKQLEFEDQLTRMIHGFFVPSNTAR